MENVRYELRKLREELTKLKKENKGLKEALKSIVPILLDTQARHKGDSFHKQRVVSDLQAGLDIITEILQKAHKKGGE